MKTFYPKKNILKIDKLNFVYKLTSVILYIIHHRDHPIEKNMSSSIENLDTLNNYLFLMQKIFLLK